MDNRLSLSKTERIMHYTGLTVVILLASAFMMPLYWMFTGSFKIMSDTMKIPPEWFPSSPTLENYKTLFFNNPTLRWTFNSFFMSSMIALGAIITSTMAGYAFGKKKFPGHKALFWLLLMAMMLPNQVLVVPLFIMISKMGLTNTYMGLIVPFIAYPLGVFLVKQFMGSIPDELIEAAKIDGAGEISVFLKIIVPMTKPAIAALGIFAFVFSWNEYLWQLVVIDQTSMLTLPVAISRLAHGMSSLNLGLAMAGATVAFLPMLLVFLLFQRFFIKGLSVGSVKG